jgi:hypothetical protein
MARLVDLDDVVGPDIDVRLNGQTYLLPPDCPVEIWLAITDPPDGDNRAQTVWMQGKVLELFQIRQPALEELPQMGMAQLQSIIALAYVRQDDDAETEPSSDVERPTTRRTRGGTSRQRASKPTVARSK